VPPRSDEDYPLGSCPQDADDHLWDGHLLSVRRGGRATAGFNLARLGRRCCLSSAENFFINDPTVVRGYPSWTDSPKRLLNHGLVARPVYFGKKRAAASVRTGLPIDSGAGGSTGASFGAITWTGFVRKDFTPRRFFPDILMRHLPESVANQLSRKCTVLRSGRKELWCAYEHARPHSSSNGSQPSLAPPPASDRELVVLMR